MRDINSTLLTFIGRTEANRAYKLARYRFDDGVEIESKLFSAAALSWMRGRKQPPSRLLIVGTPTSGWDVLMELVETLAPGRADQALEWAIPVSERLAEGAIAPEMLRQFEERFSQALGLRLDLVLAQNDGDSVFAALNGALSPNEQVVLDITHSYRTMPVHALVALGAMRWMKGVQLRDIMYGSLDERDSAGVSAGRSLGATARLAEATPALAQLALVDDVGGIASYLGESMRSSNLKQTLEDTQRLESIMQFDKASAKRGQALGDLRTLSDEPGARAVIAAAAMVGATLESLNLGTGSYGLMNRARRALDRDDFMRAVGLANEALALKVVELHGLREKAKHAKSRPQYYGQSLYSIVNSFAKAEIERNTIRSGVPRCGKVEASTAWITLNNARNSVMHGGSGLTDQAPPPELLSPESLRALLEWSFRFYEFLE
jgi:CRISPR-associated Csx2 family protein